MRLSQQPELSALIKQSDRLRATPEWRTAAEQFEDRFHVTFDTLTYFEPSVLEALHADDADLDAAVFSAPINDIVAASDTLRRVANKHLATSSDRLRYREALLSIYSKLPRKPDVINAKDSLFIGIHREGAELADALGWAPAGRSATLHAKRVPLNFGLLIGTGPLNPTQAHVPERVVIVDGAIASGATIIAILKKHAFRRVDVFSAHASSQGARALLRYARATGLALELTAGFITDGLSPLFYAMQNGKKVVGDLGDTICGAGPAH